MNVVLSGLTGTRCFVFIDDVVVDARSFAEHDAKLREVFDRIRGNRLKLKPEKCKFLRKEAIYPGHEISERAKTKVIEEYPRPQNMKQLRRFFGIIDLLLTICAKRQLHSCPSSQLTEEEHYVRVDCSSRAGISSPKRKLIATSF